MFGMTTTGGSEIVYGLVQHSESQVFRSVLERVGLPIAPKPAIVLVDQLEELLKRFPVQALDWANTLTNQHTRDNLARVIFVCNRQPCPGDLRLQLRRWLLALAQF